MNVIALCKLGLRKLWPGKGATGFGTYNKNIQEFNVTGQSASVKKMTSENLSTLSLAMKKLEDINIKLQRSDQLWRSFFSTVNDAVVLTDPNDDIIKINNFASKMYGYKKSTFYSKTFHELFIDQQSFLEHEETLHSKNPKSKFVQTYHKHKNGHIFPVEISSTSFKVSGERFHIYIIRDISQQKSIENALVELNRNLENRINERTQSLKTTLSLVNATIESTTDGILAIDNEGTITNYNNKLIDMWSLPKDLIQSHNSEKFFDHILKKIRNPDTFTNLAEQLHKNPKHNLSQQLNLEAGSIFECFSLPQQIDNIPVGRVWSFRDITEQKLLEQQLAHQATHDTLTNLPN